MADSTVARRYAKGLLQAVLQLDAEGQGPEQVANEVRLLADTVADFSGLRVMVVNPSIDSDKKVAVLDELASRIGCGAVVRRLVLVLGESERLDHLDAVAGAFRRLVDEHLGVIDAEVTTPTTLGDAEIDDLRDKLARTTGREVRLRTRTDPDLLGGLVTRIGDVIYDGSLRHHLTRIHGRMVEGGDRQREGTDG